MEIKDRITTQYQWRNKCRKRSNKYKRRKHYSIWYDTIGVKVDGVTTTFTNDGTITLKEGTVKGTGISVVRGTAINNGTIALGLGAENGSKNLAIKNADGTAKNTGKIKITDKTSEELKDFDISTLCNGSYINSGMLVDKNGIAIEKENDVEIVEIQMQEI